MLNITGDQLRAAKLTTAMSDAGHRARCGASPLCARGLGQELHDACTTGVMLLAGLLSLGLSQGLAGKKNYSP